MGYAAILGDTANDNTPLTVEQIHLHNHPTRVYNLEITSAKGQITHNYMVGNQLVWGHNGKAWKIAGKLRNRGYIPIPGDQKRTPCGCRKNYMKGSITVSIDCNENGYEPEPHIDVKRPGKPKIRIPWDALK